MKDIIYKLKMQDIFNIYCDDRECEGCEYETSINCIDDFEEDFIARYINDIPLYK